MSKLHFTSPTIEGEGIIFEYDDDGDLIKVEFNCKLTSVQYSWIGNSLPHRIDLAPQILAPAIRKGAKLETLPEEPPTFEVFWKRYQDDKGSKTKAQVKFAALSDIDKLDCWRNLPAYLKKKATNGEFKPHAATFLHQKLWR